MAARCDERGHVEGRPHARSTPGDDVAPAGKPGLRGVGASPARLAAALRSIVPSSGISTTRAEMRAPTPGIDARMARRRVIPSCASMRRSRSSSIAWRLSSRRAIIPAGFDDEGIEGLFEARLLDRDRFGQLPPSGRQRLENRLLGVR